MSDVSDKPQKQSALVQIVQGTLLLFLVVGILIYSNWDEFSAFLRSLLWPLIIALIFLVVCFVFIRFTLHRHRYSVRRFKKWHIIKRIVAYRADPQKLSNAVENVDHLDELDTKVEHRTLTNMAYELKEAEDDYNRAIKRCNASKAAERAVKEAYIQRCARIKDKYKT